MLRKSLMYGPNFTHDVDHVRKSPFRAGSKVIRVLIARKEGEPGNEANITCFTRYATGFTRYAIGFTRYATRAACSLVNQPVFPYTRMRTRKVGGGNAEKHAGFPRISSAHFPRAHARIRLVHETMLHDDVSSHI